MEAAERKVIIFKQTVSIGYVQVCSVLEKVDGTVIIDVLFNRDF